MDAHSAGDSLPPSKMSVHTTPKSTHNTKRTSAEFAAGDFNESLIVEEMKKLCNKNDDLDGQSGDDSVKTDSSEPSVDEYKKMIASDSYWSSKLRAQRRVAKRRTVKCVSEGVRRILTDEPSFTQ